MKLHLLLTPEVNSKRPESVTIPVDYGVIDIVSNDDGSIIRGSNCVIDGNQGDISKWLKECGGAWIGNGIPMMESFEFIPPEGLK